MHGARKVALRVRRPNAPARRLYQFSGVLVERALRQEFLLQGQYVEDVLMAIYVHGEPSSRSDSQPWAAVSCVARIAPTAAGRQVPWRRCLAVLHFEEVVSEHFLVLADEPKRERGISLKTVVAKGMSSSGSVRLTASPSGGCAVCSARV